MSSRSACSFSDAFRTPAAVKDALGEQARRVSRAAAADLDGPVAQLVGLVTLTGEQGGGIWAGQAPDHVGLTTSSTRSNRRARCAMRHL